jgi:uncharacterized protein YydD (DUF2326 family)
MSQPIFPADWTTSLDEPRIWVQELALYRSIEPLDEIRTIPFNSGINIIWGVEDEAAEGVSFEPGHGVGKTTLCRLIRYCFGESSFGQNFTVHEVCSTFPKGYVVMIVRIYGQSWTVARPIGRDQTSFAAQDKSISEIVTKKSQHDNFDAFLTEIETKVFAETFCDGLLSNGGSLHWGHVLSLCSRDQETRYQSVWELRSKRSNSKLKAIDILKKADVFLCIRALLGLVTDKEREERAKLRKATANIKDLDSQIEEMRREPEYSIKMLRQILSERFDLDDLSDSTMDTNSIFGIPNIVNSRTSAIAKELGQLDEQIEECQKQMRVVIAQIRKPKEMIAGPKSDIAALQGGMQLMSGISKNDEQYRNELTDIADIPCDYGRRLIGECIHVKEELQRIDKENTEKSLANAQDIAKHEQDIAEIKREIKGTQDQVSTYAQKLKKLDAEFRELNEKRARLELQQKELPEVYAQLQQQESIKSGDVEGTDLGLLIDQKSDCEISATQSKKELSLISESFEQSIDPFRKSFEAIVKAVLSSDYVGTVKPSLDEINFTIRRRHSLAGEAFQTLTILIADLALLITGATRGAKHPCFLIHDSPREADLGINIYRHFINTADRLCDELKSGPEVPFQYIITTTTPPTDPSKSEPVAILKLGGKYGTLFVDPLKSDDNSSGPLLFDEDDGNTSDEKETT